MKEQKHGDDHYKRRGLVKMVGWVPQNISNLYKRARKKRGWSKTKFNSYWLEKKAPR